MKALFYVPLVALACACSGNRCIETAQNTWRIEVAKCAAEGKDAKACELDRLTSERKTAEEGCIE